MLYTVQRVSKHTVRNEQQNILRQSISVMYRIIKT
jgi:hypothetical protein